MLPYRLGAIADEAGTYPVDRLSDEDVDSNPPNGPVEKGRVDGNGWETAEAEVAVEDGLPTDDVCGCGPLLLVLLLSAADFCALPTSGPESTAVSETLAVESTGDPTPEPEADPFAEVLDC